MIVEQVAVSALIPYEFNNRRHSEEQVNRIANSIKEFGFQQPLVIDSSNVVLVGHGRLLAAQKLGLEKVPVVRASELTDTQKKAFRILDNKLQNDSTWDFDNLRLELGGLEDLGFDLDHWGLDALQDLVLGEDDREVREDDFEAGADFGQEPFIKKGDLIELGEHRVLCGDSTASSDVSQLVNGDVMLCLTDPPYCCNYENLERDHGHRTVSEAGHVYVDRDVDNILKFISLIPCDGLLMSFPFNLFFQELANVTKDWDLKCELIWKKQSPVYSINAFYQQQHEPILVYRRKKHKKWVCSAPKTQTTILEYDRQQKNKDHPTPKPVELWGKLLGYHTNVGDGVYDPFLGSGTTLIAAEQLGRRCYGMEIEPKYCQVIMKRYATHKQNAGEDCIIKVNGEPFDLAYLEAA